MRAVFKPSGLDAGAFAFVMATGIVSVAAALESLSLLSDALFALACAAWIVFVAVAIRAPAPGRPRIEAFAAVAATAVLGARLVLFRDDELALCLWFLAVLVWAALVARRPTWGEARGSSLLLVVGTESLAVLGALLAPRFGVVLRDAALVAWVLGLALYLPVVSLVAYRRGRFAPDIWIAMGALAIATLAGSELVLASRALHALRVVDEITWVVATLLIVPLAVCELRLRDWRYEAARWAFVFPLGMYVVASRTLARAGGGGWPDALSRVFLPIAIAAWVLVGLSWIVASRGAVARRLP